MPLVEIHQFGGSDGSYAGDCCLIYIASAPPLWCIIDLGTSTNTDLGEKPKKSKGKSRGPKFAGKTQFERAFAVLRTKAAKAGYLVITHWHADHIGGQDHESYVRALGTCEKVRTLAAADVAKAKPAVLRDEKAKNGREAFAVAIGSHTFTLQLIYPDFVAVAAKTTIDENLCSLGALLTIRETMSKKLLFSFLTMGDMHPVDKATAPNEVQALAVVGKTPIHLLKFPHHGSQANYFETLFPNILKAGTCHVVISGYTSGDATSLRKLHAHGAASVTLLVQDPQKVAKLMTWAGYQTLAKSWGLTTWCDAVITIDTSEGSALMTGNAWSVAATYGAFAKLGGAVSRDLFGAVAGAGGGGDDDEKKGGEDEKDGGGEGEGDDEKGDYDQFHDWEEVNGTLKWGGADENEIIGVSYPDEGYVLVRTEGGGQCFYRCCARYLHGDPARCDEVRQALAATLGGAERDRVANVAEFATFEDIAATATLLNIPIVVHLSPMADEDQNVSLVKTYNDASNKIPLYVLFEYNPADGAGHISTLLRVE